MSKEEIDKFLENASGWKLVPNAIERNLKFLDFNQAVEFINKVAVLAEHENHHPDILLWGWNNVKITLSTHSAKGVSEKDLALAIKIDGIKMNH